MHTWYVAYITFNFTHIDNTLETPMSTSGCLIVGETQQDLEVSKDGFIGSSTVAYKNDAKSSKSIITR